MKEIDTILPSLLGYLKENKPKYLYNQSFVPGKSQVLYSGPQGAELLCEVGAGSGLYAVYGVMGEPRCQLPRHRHGRLRRGWLCDRV